MPQSAEVIELPIARTRYAAADRPPRNWPGYALIACGVALVPWLVVLATGVPATGTAPHWNVAWVGLDSMEAVGLVVTGRLTLRNSPRRVPFAAATAMLLVCDAWFDTTTATGAAFAAAILMAVTAELPLAAACATLALRGFSVPQAAASVTPIRNRVPAPAPKTSAPCA